MSSVAYATDGGRPDDRAFGTERREIEIRAFLHPTNRIEAWVWQDFAVHKCLNDNRLWQITMLPLGMCLAVDWCAFFSFAQAVAAIKEMAALRNDWHVIRKADLTKALEAQLQAIANKHGAPETLSFETQTGRAWVVGAAGEVDRNKLGMVMKTRPNGYGAALDL